MQMTVDELKRWLEDELKRGEALLQRLSERPETDIVNVIETPYLNYNYEETT